MKNAFWIFAFAILILVLFLPTFSKKQQLLERNREYQAEIARLKKLNIELKEEKRKLKDDPVYLEKVAREKMGLVRDGEVIYRIQKVPANQGNQ